MHTARFIATVFILLFVPLQGNALNVEIKNRGPLPILEIRDSARAIFILGKTNQPNLTITIAAAKLPVRFSRVKSRRNRVEFREVSVGGLKVSESFETLNTSLIRRTTRFTAASNVTFFATLEYFPQIIGDYYSFHRQETKPVFYNQENSGQWAGAPASSWPKPEVEENAQLFPFAALMSDGMVYGVFGDAPAFSRNRSYQFIDPVSKSFRLQNGDHRSPVKLGIDSRDVTFDHQQTLRAGETLTWTTYIFSSPAKSQYELQLAAHLALANAHGWNGSAVEAISRNIGYLLCRRNLLNWGTNSDTIIISGINYGWKQWSSDSFYTALGLQQPKISQNAYNGLFLQRLTYEDNAQLYLIWSALMKRNGGNVNDELARQAFAFIRKQETIGAFIPPRLQPNFPDGKPNLGWKTYMDLFFYDDGDCPTSDQGFHCAALVAAKELGFAIGEGDIERAAKVYRDMFNEKGGYFATSRQLQQIVSQDALMGEVLGYAFFGRKFLPDELVRHHIATVEKGKTPHGLRVFCQPDGSLLPVVEYGRSNAPNPNITEARQGAYVSGGSWFFCDELTYLAGTIHGVDTEAMQQWRIERELRDQPSFKEYLHTVTGAPEGNLLYSWNSAYWFLRHQVRERMKAKGKDEMLARVDEKLGVKRVKGELKIERTANLKP
ncbi:MAG: hypothetical protein ABIQ35_12460 [Verrucomicrobiota bacterium]